MVERPSKSVHPRVEVTVCNHVLPGAQGARASFPADRMPDRERDSTKFLLSRKVYRRFRMNQGFVSRNPNGVAKNEIISMYLQEPRPGQRVLGRARLWGRPSRFRFIRPDAVAPM